jgi:hypothetical protein
MYVRNGANNAWQEVTSVGDFKFLFLCPKNGGSGNPTFDSNEKEFDLRETSNSGTGASVTSAAQLTISVNGVVQKPNAGTNESGLDGFVLADSNTIKFCGAPAANDEIFVIQSGSAVTLNAPANNTVATDTLQSQAVTEAKMLISNAPSDGKFLQYKDSSDKLTWADVPAGVGGATGVDFNDEVKARWGTGNDLEIYHTATGNQSIISNSSAGNLHLKTSNGTQIEVHTVGATSDYVTLRFGQVDRLQTTVDGVKLLKAATEGAEIHLLEGLNNGSAYVGLACPDDKGSDASYVITLPSAAPTANGQALVATTAGVASWDTVSSTSLDGCGYQNDQTISAGTYSIAANKGMHSVGPITNNGTVTVNGTWVIS